MTGILYDYREEQFAQLIVSGIPPKEAKEQAGFARTRSPSKLLKTPRIKERIDQLLLSSAYKAELSRAHLIDEVRKESLLAREAGQHSAALKGLEMLGKELHKMFIDRKEVGGPGDFDNKTEEELKEFIIKHLAELGINDPVHFAEQITNTIETPKKSDTIN